MSLSAEELRQKINAAQDLPSEPCVVPEWGITEEDGMLLQGLNGHDLDTYQASFRQFRGNKQIITLEDMRSRLVALCLVSADREQVFGYKRVKELAEKSGAALDRLFDQASKLSGMTEAAVEEMVANFENAPNADSPSDSPSDSDGQ